MTIIQPQRFAIIDLGSNTARVIVVNTTLGYAYRLEDEIREVVRLRQGLTKHGLGREAMDRAIFTLRLFKRFCDSMEVDEIIATATSAVREAANGPAFLERVRLEVGISLRVLTGEQEAYYGVLGVLNEVHIDNSIIVDIGGGSAQISEVRQQRFERGQSLTLGALALTEQFIQHDPITPDEIKVVQTEINEQLDTIAWLKPKNLAIIGLGGTIRNLARIEAARQIYPLNTLHAFKLTRASIEQTISDLQQNTLDNRRTIHGLKPDRADIILPGAMVIATIMKRLKTNFITVSTNGLREGLFFEQFWHHLSYPVIADVRRFSVLNMARVYNYQKNHANHVRYLAGRLFEQLTPLHGYSPQERELLDAAALIHDLGTIISYRNHHKHSQTLIINSGLPGFSPREVALIALMTRYHRKGTPDPSPFALVLDEDDTLLLTRLAAILRLAEFLERGRNATVDDIIATWDDKTLYLTLVADEYPAVELWETERNAVSLVKNAFKLDVVLDSTAAPGD